MFVSNFENNIFSWKSIWAKKSHNVLSSTHSLHNNQMHMGGATYPRTVCASLGSAASLESCRFWLRFWPLGLEFWDHLPAISLLIHHYLPWTLRSAEVLIWWWSFRQNYGDKPPLGLGNWVMAIKRKRVDLNATDQNQYTQNLLFNPIASVQLQPQNPCNPFLCR